MQTIDPMRNSRNRATEPAMTPAKAPFDKCEWEVELGGLALDAIPEELGLEISFAGDQHLIVK
jgi:hypothetical protein